VRLTSRQRNAHRASGLFRGARYGTLGGGTDRDAQGYLIGKRICDGFPADGFLGMEAF